MKFTDSLKQSIEAVKLDRKTIVNIHKDKNNLWNAIIIVAIAGALGGLGNTLWQGAGATEFITGAVGSVIGLFVFTALIYVMGMIFSVKTDYMSLYRVFGHIQILGWLSIIPVIGGIASIWGLVVLTVAISEIMKVSNVKAFLIWFIPLAVIVLVFMFLFAAAFGAFLAGAGLGALAGTV